MDGFEVVRLPAQLLQQCAQRIAGLDGDVGGFRATIQRDGGGGAAERGKLLMQLLQTGLGLQRDDGVVSRLVDVSHFASPPDRNLLHSRMGWICVRRSHCRQRDASHAASWQE